MLTVSTFQKSTLETIAVPEQDRNETKKRRLKKPDRAKPYHHGDLKEALVTAALELVDSKGPRGFSLAEVCRQAGVSVAAPYRHFEDKQSLMAAVAQSSFLLFEKHLALARAKHAHDPIEAIRAIAYAYVDFARVNPSRFRVMFSSELKKARFPELYATAHSTFEVVLSTIESYRDPDGADRAGTYMQAVSMWSQCHGIAYLLVDGFLREVSIEHRVDNVLAIAVERFIDAIKPR